MRLTLILLIFGPAFAFCAITDFFVHMLSEHELNRTLCEEAFSWDDDIMLDYAKYIMKRDTNKYNKIRRFIFENEFLSNKTSNLFVNECNVSGKIHSKIIIEIITIAVVAISLTVHITLLIMSRKKVYNRRRVIVPLNNLEAQDIEELQKSLITETQPQPSTSRGENSGIKSALKDININGVSLNKLENAMRDKKKVRFTDV